MRERLVKAVKERGLKLRQTYQRLSKKSLHRQSRYRHGRQTKRADKQTKKLKNYLGRVVRNIQRLVLRPDDQLSGLLDLAERLYHQKRKDTRKVYSVHAPEGECICKGKAPKRTTIVPMMIILYEPPWIRQPG